MKFDPTYLLLGVIGALISFLVGHEVAPSPMSLPEPAPSGCHDSVVSIYTLDATSRHAQCALGARVIVDSAAGLVTCECPDPPLIAAPVSWEVTP